MSNREIQAAQNYHSGTKHPNGYLMDPSHDYHPGWEPLKFKIYQGAELIARGAVRQQNGQPREDIPQVSEWIKLVPQARSDQQAQVQHGD